MDSKFDYSTHESWQQEIRRWEAEGDVKELAELALRMLADIEQREWAIDRLEHDIAYSYD